ncbi:MAG: sigma-70 family RNA polymerase sigma factor [Acidobacteriota bacterium]
MTRADLTELLHGWRDGRDDAVSQLMPQVHSELLRVARHAMRGERQAHTLQPTALVHEAFLRLMGSEVPWQDRAHFFAVSASLMRRILVDHARGARRLKRGGGAAHLALQVHDAVDPGPDVDLRALDTALERLAERDPDQSRMIELCYFGGLSYPEIAEVLGVSRATVGRELRFAKAWLRRQLSEDK